ncbi:hypothetical protein [Pseudalkalibacillus salsuginis]|uniref:hypothetical protein n=1 Tax=Pseudalkalibacillus salsuginis TaxID=2910972 RepID=UPI001CD7E7F8|nr:hypothetical protein [Pseudalkalibacillus salsuginis]MCF6409344.1 hypothetical protein [Pseudalkalibacillus salsuginis]
MNRRNVNWLPVIASVGIGAAAYSMMTGQAGQLQNVIPGLSNMGGMGGNTQANQATNQMQ